MYETAVSPLLHSLFSFLSLIILLSSFPLTLTLSQSGFMSVSGVGWTCQFLQYHPNAPQKHTHKASEQDQMFDNPVCVGMCMGVCKAMRSGYFTDIVLHLLVQQQCPHALSTFFLTEPQIEQQSVVAEQSCFAVFATSNSGTSLKMPNQLQQLLYLIAGRNFDKCREQISVKSCQMVFHFKRT